LTRRWSTFAARGAASLAVAALVAAGLPAGAATDPPTETRPRPPGDPANVQDAHADRVVLVPTAFVHPAGTVYFSTYDIVVLQAGYAVADGSQISLTATPPIEGTIVPVDLSLKTALAREGPVRVAATGSVSGIWGLDQGNFVIGRVGATTQLCFEPTCRSSASIAANLLLAGAALAMTGVGVVWRVAPWLSLLLEVDTLVPLSRDAGKVEGIAVLPGLRLPHRTWSLDVALGRATGVTPSLPLLAFTYRFLP
jgi:hypothetical protein